MIYGIVDKGMKKTAIIMVVGLFFAGTMIVSAQETVSVEILEQNPVAEVVSEEKTPEILTQEQILMQELAGLRIREQETNGFFAKLVLRTRIRQIENQLNIKKALQ